MKVHNLIEILSHMPVHADVIWSDMSGVMSCPKPYYCEKSGEVVIDIEEESITDEATLTSDILIWKDEEIT